MAHLLHIDSSISGPASVSRALTARAADAWKTAHPDGTVTYRDLGANPLPHLDSESALAGMTPAAERRPKQSAAWGLSELVVREVREATTIILGLPLYNYGVHSSVKAWVDYLIAPGLSMDPHTREPLLGGRELLVLATCGGGYGPGTPRDGWDHARQWLPHGLAMTGLEPEFISTELTLAAVTPGMDDLIPLAEQSRAGAELAIDQRWIPDLVR
ncbi:FMN-dependent NADH-azoreductase [Rhodococcus wratislaviensis]|uniref:FMN dependent NADH:quinone oxidoreductase n=1 Tax=Rhodococcus wratislaviensis NBRC 100605 TaxID=1219028 RepID=X0Q0C3_RHOWR|nr:NAD(P)H-dependent oxidoreductase [Rhodococcus wratislaviensis]GAF43571.1 FMN-dependent NADH-azoreductase [Rhodococcus wratislaviensis NBRC 100605]